jgi:hypothetical protein
MRVNIPGRNGHGFKAYNAYRNQTNPPGILKAFLVYKLLQNLEPMHIPDHFN